MLPLPGGGWFVDVEDMYTYPNRGRIGITTPNTQDVYYQGESYRTALGLE